MIVLQWNVQWCRGMDGRVDPARIVAAARAMADFDVLCLQEVAVNFPALEGSVGEDQPFALASRLVGHEPVYAAAVDVPGGQETRRRFGNMIFSRYPVQQVFRHSLPWPADHAAPSMPRVALEVVVDTPLGGVRILSTHLEYYSALQRAAQVERLRELHAEACGHAVAAAPERGDGGPFEPLPQPRAAILCGDFNLPEGHADPLHARMQAPLGEGIPRFVDAWHACRGDAPCPPTFRVHEQPRECEPYACDFVFVTEDLAPRLKRIDIDGETQASDHQPVLVELDA